MGGFGVSEGWIVKEGGCKWEVLLNDKEQGCKGEEEVVKKKVLRQRDGKGFFQMEVYIFIKINVSFLIINL